MVIPGAYGAALVMAKILTQRSVDSAKPRPERFGIPCGLVPGLQLTVQASGFKSFSLFARIHGKQVKLSVGKAGVLTLAQARDQARQLLVRIARGEDPRAKRQAQPAPETLRLLSRASSSVTSRPIDLGVPSSALSRVMFCPAGAVERSSQSPRATSSACSMRSLIVMRRFKPIAHWRR
jgi:hypothetical protein